MPYHADLSAGSLMLPESRVIARLLSTRPTQADWEQALRVDNVLQKRAPSTAIRQARLIRFRLESLDAASWPLISEGDKEVATQTLFAASLKHSQLLRDFVRDVVAGHWRRLERTLSPKDWPPFIADCIARDASVSTWGESTLKKHLQVILRILAEARYVDSTRSLQLIAPHLNPAVKSMLRNTGDSDLIGVMELKS